MIKKARDLKPGDVVGGKKVVSVHVAELNVNVYHTLGDGSTRFSPDQDVLVDKEAPQSCCEVELGKPVSKGTDGPFYVNFLGLYDTYNYYVRDKNNIVGWWRTRAMAEDAADYLNSLFSQQPEVVTKPAQYLKVGDKIFMSVREVNHYPRPGHVDVRIAVSKHGFRRWLRFSDGGSEEVQVIEPTQ